MKRLFFSAISQFIVLFMSVSFTASASDTVNAPNKGNDDKPHSSRVFPFNAADIGAFNEAKRTGAFVTPKYGKRKPLEHIDLAESTPRAVKPTAKPNDHLDLAVVRSTPRAKSSDFLAPPRAPFAKSGAPVENKETQGTVSQPSARQSKSGFVAKEVAVNGKGRQKKVYSRKTSTESRDSLSVSSASNNSGPESSRSGSPSRRSQSSDKEHKGLFIPAGSSVPAEPSVSRKRDSGMRRDSQRSQSPSQAGPRVHPKMSQAELDHLSETPNWARTPGRGSQSQSGSPSSNEGMISGALGLGQSNDGLGADGRESISESRNRIASRFGIPEEEGDEESNAASMNREESASRLATHQEQDEEEEQKRGSVSVSQPRADSDASERDSMSLSGRFGLDPTSQGLNVLTSFGQIPWTPRTPAWCDTPADSHQ